MPPSFVNTLVLISALAFPISTRAAFAVNYQANPSQCSPFLLSFKGLATPPFSLYVLPISSTSPIKIPLPSGTWNTTTLTGEWKTIIPLPAGTQFMLSMTDGAGKSGVVSDVQTMGMSSTTSCLGSSSSPPRMSFNPTTPVQCHPLLISWPSSITANKPVSIRGYVSQGSQFPVGTPQSDEYAWTVDVPVGGQFILSLEDAQGQLLETSPLFRSNPGEDVSCLSGGASDHNNQSPISIGVVVGGALGALALVGLIIFGLIRFMRRRRAHAEQEKLGGTGVSSLPPKPPYQHQELSTSSASVTSRQLDPNFVTNHAAHLVRSQSAASFEPSLSSNFSHSQRFQSNHGSASLSGFDPSDALSQFSHSSQDARGYLPTGSASASTTSTTFLLSTRPPPRSQVPQTPLSASDTYSSPLTSPTSGHLRTTSDMMGPAEMEMVAIRNVTEVREGSLRSVPAPSPSPSTTVSSGPSRSRSKTITAPRRYRDEKGPLPGEYRPRADIRRGATVGAVVVTPTSRDRNELGLSFSAPPPSYDSVVQDR